MKGRKWVLSVTGSYFLILALIVVIGFIVDPYFHYHEPIAGMSYMMEEEQYMNDGIAKHFSYDAIIVGTSMTQFFSTELTDELFGVDSVRLTMKGEGFKRLNELTETAIENQPDLKIVIRGIDPVWFTTNAEYQGYESYPEYLYNNNIWDDMEYLLNGEVVVNRVFPQVVRTLAKIPAKSFDDYLTLNAGNAEAVVRQFSRTGIEKSIVTEEETRMYVEQLMQNLDVNVVPVVEQNPEITFYFFFPPYSIFWWDDLRLRGEDVLERRLLLERLVIERLLPYDNVKLFSFNANEEWICDLDHYMDNIHYSKEASDDILQWMANEEYLLTKENYKEYIQKTNNFFTTFDYNAYYENILKKVQTSSNE